MIFNFEEKPSVSPYVEVIWRNHSERGGQFISMASSHWQMVITKHEDKTRLTVRGPETKATPAYCPPGAEHFGIYFKHGVVMPNLTAIHLRDGMLDLPEARSDSFWLNGSTWQFPDYENADTFVDCLMRDELLTHEPIVDTALRADRPVLSVRSVQRRFLKATGLTRGTLSQIDRARYATNLLQQGVSIPDTVDQAGYSDQPHLTRSLKYFIGQTPAQIIRKDETSQLSFLSRMYQPPDY
jgi:AraC-like DNA-binding protein